MYQPALIMNARQEGVLSKWHEYAITLCLFIVLFDASTVYHAFVHWYCYLCTLSQRTFVQ